MTQIVSQVTLVVVSDAEAETRRELSSAVFNNRYFGDVAAGILEDTRPSTALVTTRQLASATGLADSVVRSVLLRLVDAGVLSKLPRTGSGRSPQYYQVEDRPRLDSIVSLTVPTTAPVRRTLRSKAPDHSGT